MGRNKGLYKRGNIWWIRYAGLDGKIRYESSGSKSYRVAQALLIKRKQAIQEGKEPLPIKKIANHTFKELAERYLVWAKRQKSFDSKKYLVWALVEEFGNIPLRRMSTFIVEEFQGKILDTGRKPATANRFLAVLKHMVNKAVQWEMVEDETLKRIGKVKPLPENNKRLRYLTVEECHRLINASVPHLKPIVITALNTGMRKGEILGLRWENVDLVHGFILLDQTKNNERREIPINQTLRETFKHLPRRLDSPYVFIDEKGNRFKDVKRSFHSALRRAKIQDFHFHDCRHTFASHLVMSGIDITTVKELLGHKTLAMTLRYSHLSPSHKVSAVSILDETLKGEPTIQKLYNLRERKAGSISQPIEKKSGAGGDRTRDLLNAIQARSQLRHSPISLRFCQFLITS